MISFKCVKLYCNDDITKIENYEIAINDNTQIYDCHHRLETDLRVSPKELMSKNLYYKRPADELIFLTHSDHIRIHNLNPTEEYTKNLSKAKSGKNHPFYGMHHNAESLQKISESSRGREFTDDHRNKISKSLKGKPKSDEHKQKLSKSLRGKHWKLVDGKRFYY